MAKNNKTKRITEFKTGGRLTDFLGKIGRGGTNADLQAAARPIIARLWTVLQLQGVADILRAGELETAADLIRIRFFSPARDGRELRINFFVGKGDVCRREMLTIGGENSCTAVILNPATCFIRAGVEWILTPNPEAF